MSILRRRLTFPGVMVPNCPRCASLGTASTVGTPSSCDSHPGPRGRQPDAFQLGLLGVAGTLEAFVFGQGALGVYLIEQLLERGIAPRGRRGQPVGLLRPARVRGD